MESSKGARRVSVVIPVYNNAESLHELASRLLESTFALSDIDFEIIFIDDGSTDNSWEVIEQLSEKNKAVKGIRFQKN